jgi:hypothetical protein
MEIEMKSYIVTIAFQVQAKGIDHAVDIGDMIRDVVEVQDMYGTLEKNFESSVITDVEKAE